MAQVGTFLDNGISKRPSLLISERGECGRRQVLIQSGHCPPTCKTQKDNYRHPCHSLTSWQ